MRGMRKSTSAVLPPFVSVLSPAEWRRRGGMDIKDLMSWPWAKPGEGPFDRAEDAYRTLQSDINRAFEMFAQQIPPARLRAGIDLNLAAEVRVDVCETDEEIEITAEMPGVAESTLKSACSSGC